MKLLKNSNPLKASSLVETVMAITLISICSLIALVIYLNVVSQNNPIYYYEAKHTVEKLTLAAAQEQDFEDDTYRYKNYTIEKTTEVNAEEHIAIINYKIQIGQRAYTLKKLITIENKD